MAGPRAAVAFLATFVVIGLLLPSSQAADGEYTYQDDDDLVGCAAGSDFAEALPLLLKHCAPLLAKGNKPCSKFCHQAFLRVVSQSYCLEDEQWQDGFTETWDGAQDSLSAAEAVSLIFTEAFSRCHTATLMPTGPSSSADVCSSAELGQFKADVIAPLRSVCNPAVGCVSGCSHIYSLARRHPCFPKFFASARRSNSPLVAQFEKISKACALTSNAAMSIQEMCTYDQAIRFKDLTWSNFLQSCRGTRFGTQVKRIKPRKNKNANSKGNDKTADSSTKKRLLLEADEDTPEVVFEEDFEPQFELEDVEATQMTSEDIQARQLADGASGKANGAKAAKAGKAAGAGTAGKAGNNKAGKANAAAQDKAAKAALDTKAAKKAQKARAKAIEQAKAAKANKASPSKASKADTKAGKTSGNNEKNKKNKKKKKDKPSDAMCTSRCSSALKAVLADMYCLERMEANAAVSGNVGATAMLADALSTCDMTRPPPTPTFGVLVEEAADDDDSASSSAATMTSSVATVVLSALVMALICL